MSLNKYGIPAAVFLIGLLIGGVITNHLTPTFDGLGIFCSLDKTKYQIGDKPLFTIYNKLESSITFGSVFYLYHLVDDEWVEVFPFDTNSSEFAWVASLLELPSGSQYSNSHHTSQLESGRYRLVKEVTNTKYHHVVNLTCEYVLE